MITPQLVAFIRGQLTAGVPQGTIRQSLISNGWAAQDIADAFANASPKASVIQAVVQHPFTHRKFALSLVFIIVSIVYVVWQNLGGGQSAITQTPGVGITPGQSYKAANDVLLQTLSNIGTSVLPSTTPSPGLPPVESQTPPVSQPTTQTSAPTPTPVPAPQKPTGLYVDGSYTGSPADAYYGTVQVKAIIKNGQLADVQFLQYPSDRNTSRYINGQAMPLLTQEAIQAQSAQVDGVSGATFTSQAFQQSLASALALAKN
jgi:uncharacterized protein with FMN-binding domain